LIFNNELFINYSLYFANSGLQTQLNLLNTGQAWYTLVVLIILASIAKIVPVTLVSKLCSKKPWFYCLSIGVLMNTRGIVQLVVLNIGVELGVLSPKIFSIFVLMATILTFLTSPILSLLYRKKYDVQKVSTPNVDEDLRNIKEEEISMDVINNKDDNIPTISNGDITINEDKPNSIKSPRRSSTNMPPHDTYVTVDDRIDYARINSNSSNQNTDDYDVFEDVPTRPINMTRF
jgi:hypothetical protein